MNVDALCGAAILTGDFQCEVASIFDGLSGNMEESIHKHRSSSLKFLASFIFTGSKSVIQFITYEKEMNQRYPINPLKPSELIHTTSFNILKLCILPTECIFVFRVVLTINSDCFPKQH
jgi:hypothetical protein